MKVTKEIKNLFILLSIVLLGIGIYLYISNKNTEHFKFTKTKTLPRQSGNSNKPPAANTDSEEIQKIKKQLEQMQQQMDRFKLQQQTYQQEYTSRTKA